MKKIAKILIALGIGLLVAGVILYDWHCNKPNPTPTPLVDTTKYTDVVLINDSELDSVQVFLTLQGDESIIGLFGMDSSNIVTYCTDSTPCVGSFWAKKGFEYHLGDTNTISGAIVTWGVQNQACTAAQNAGFPFGINNFEFTVNTWWQNGTIEGANESADITCVDGLHSILSMSVTSTGPRADSLSTNFGAFWDFGYTDSTGLVPFKTVTNGTTLEGCVNLPGVFPYGCDWGYKSFQPPTPCTNPSYPVKCSDKWGQINTSQLNRPGQGGQIICRFIGFTADPQPAIK
jgi:hypothetical protein